MADHMVQEQLQEDPQIHVSDSSDGESDSSSDEDEGEDVYEGALLWTKKELTKASDVLIKDDPLDTELLDSVEREWKKVSKNMDVHTCTVHVIEAVIFC